MARKALLLLVTTSLGGTAAGSYIQLYTGVLLLLTFMILQVSVGRHKHGT